MQTITFGIELIAHVLKIEHAIEADTSHAQEHLVVYVRVRVCVAKCNDDLLMINRIQNTSTALATTKHQSQRCSAHYYYDCFPFTCLLLLLYVCSLPR